jgi:hypothetical protein
MGIHRADHATPLSAKVGTKFCQQAAVAQSIQFTCRLKAMEFVCLILTVKAITSGGRGGEVLLLINSNCCGRTSE